MGIDSFFYSSLRFLCIQMLVIEFKSEGLQKTMVSVQSSFLLPVFSLFDTRGSQTLVYKHLAIFDTKTTTRTLKTLFRRDIPTIIHSREDLRDAVNSD